MSDQKQIFAAFVAAQQAFGPALKTSANPHFKSRYADLAACVEAVIDALNANGIGLIQRTLECDSGVSVETLFVHTSGESFGSGPLHVPAAKSDPQGYGSALTYARRYSLMAACGIAPEDDDGNAASRSAKQRPAIKPSPSDAKPTSGAGAGLAPERKAEIEEMALYMIDCHKEGNDLPAIEMCAEISDADEKVFLWSLLSAESKLRSTIKANSKPPAKEPK